MGAMGGLNKLSNLGITLQRRWSNMLTDAQRQHIVELFLGLRLANYLPSARPLYSATSLLEVRELRAPLEQLVQKLSLCWERQDGLTSRLCDELG